jgi:hypothetical protein
MLGSDYATNTWPGCGEIDIMEHKGNEPMLFMVLCIIQGVRKMQMEILTITATEFHVYKTIESYKYQIFVDDKLIHSKATITPYHLTKIFFLIFVWLGGTWWSN